MIQNSPPWHPARSPRRGAVALGLYTRALLSLVMFCALIAANRLPGLERHALERNAAFYSLFVIFALIPVIRFLSQPFDLYLSAMIAWLMFVVAFDIAGMIFHNLFDSVRHTPFLALLEGAIVYGVIAVGSWVGAMLFQARRHPIASRHTPPHVFHRHQ